MQGGQRGSVRQAFKASGQGLEGESLKQMQRTRCCSPADPNKRRVNDDTEVNTEHGKMLSI